MILTIKKQYSQKYFWLRKLLYFLLMYEPCCWLGVTTGSFEWLFVVDNFFVNSSVTTFSWYAVGRYLLFPVIVKSNVGPPGVWFVTVVAKENNEMNKFSY